jgi:hypothetical protein
LSHKLDIQINGLFDSMLATLVNYSPGSHNLETAAKIKRSLRCFATSLGHIVLCALQRDQLTSTIHGGYATRFSHYPPTESCVFYRRLVLYEVGRPINFMTESIPANHGQQVMRRTTTGAVLTHGRIWAMSRRGSERTACHILTHLHVSTASVHWWKQGLGGK